MAQFDTEQEKKLKEFKEFLKEVDRVFSKREQHFYGHGSQPHGIAPTLDDGYEKIDKDDRAVWTGRIEDFLEETKQLNFDCLKKYLNRETVEALQKLSNRLYNVFQAIRRYNNGDRDACAEILEEKFDVKATDNSELEMACFRIVRDLELELRDILPQNPQQIQ